MKLGSNSEPSFDNQVPPPVRYGTYVPYGTGYRYLGTYRPPVQVGKRTEIEAYFLRSRDLLRFLLISSSELDIF